MTSPWWMVLNPWAGRRRDMAARVRAILDRLGIEAHLETSAGPDEVGEAVERGRAGGYRRFGAVGGDGTVGLVVDALMRRSWDAPPVLGILPAGTGCDFLRTFAISQDLERAARHLLGEQLYPADVGVLHGSWGTRHFINVAETGIGAATVRRAGGLPKRLGRRVYLAAFWLTLPFFRRSEVRVEVDGRLYEGPATNVVLANGQFFGGGLNIAPKANLVDGEVDVQVFTGPLREAVTLVPRIRRGLHLGHPHVRRMSGAVFTVESENPWSVEADGELLGESPLSGSVLRQAIAVKI